MAKRKGKRGGAREGAGRKPSGRVAYLTRLRPNRIAWIRKQASKRECEQCVVVENAIDVASGRKTPRATSDFEQKPRPLGQNQKDKMKAVASEQSAYRDGDIKWTGGKLVVSGGTQAILVRHARECGMTFGGYLRHLLDGDKTRRKAALDGAK